MVISIGGAAGAGHLMNAVYGFAEPQGHGFLGRFFLALFGDAADHLLARVFFALRRAGFAGEEFPQRQERRDDMAAPLFGKSAGAGCLCAIRSELEVYGVIGQAVFDEITKGFAVLKGQRVQLAFENLKTAPGQGVIGQRGGGKVFRRY